MAKKYPGLYLYYDWIDVLAGLPAGKAMAIIKNLRHYAQYGTEPEPLEGTAGSLQSLFLAQLKRARTNAENGKRGGALTHKSPVAEGETADEAPPDPVSDPPPLTRDDFDSLPEYIAYLRARCTHIRNHHSPAGNP